MVAAAPAVRFYRNVGGVFTIEAPLLAGDHVIAVGNWDDDPADELAVAGPDGLTVRARGDGDWSSSIQIDTVTPSVLRWCDLRGDARPELLAVVDTALLIYPNRAPPIDGNWLEPTGVFDTEVGHNYMPAVCADLDGDGADDLLYRTASGWYLVPHGANARRPVPLFGPEVVAMAFGDADGDGRGELFAAIDPCCPSCTCPTSPVNQVVVHANQSTPGTFSFGSAELVFDTGTDPPRDLAWSRLPAGTPGLPE